MYENRRGGRENGVREKRARLTEWSLRTVHQASVSTKILQFTTIELIFDKFLCNVTDIKIEVFQCGAEARTFYTIWYERGNINNLHL